MPPVFSRTNYEVDVLQSLVPERSLHIGIQLHRARADVLIEERLLPRNTKAGQHQTRGRYWHHNSEYSEPDGQL
jgi:hypothetical protein